MTDTLFPAAACVQFAIAPGEPDRNLDRVISLVEAYRPAAGTLLVLPETKHNHFVYPSRTHLFERVARWAENLP